MVHNLLSTHVEKNHNLVCHFIQSKIMNASVRKKLYRIRGLTYFIAWTVLVVLILFIESYTIQPLSLFYHFIPIVFIWVLGISGIYSVQYHFYKKNEEKLEAVKNYIDSETRYQSIIAAMSEGIVMHDAQGNIVASNKSAETILGLTTDQLYGRTSFDPNWHAIHEDGSPFPGEEHPAMVTLRTHIPQHNIIMGVQKPDGTQSWISINSEPLFHKNQTKPYAVVASFADITKEKKAQNQLAKQSVRAAQADRLQVLGEMSAGIAHELNQPLGAISATAEGILLRYENQIALSQENITQSMEEILDMVERMSDTIHHLRIFSRDKNHQETTPCSLNEAIQNSLKMIKTQLLNHNVDLSLELQEDLPLLNGNVQDLEHIFINLLTNARDALIEKENRLPNLKNWQKCITIRSGYTKDETPKVYAEIEDNGIGISQDTQHDIFRPFYTTKPEDHGTGLGLAIVQDIISRHNGQITFESVPQKSTKFRIEFPISAKLVEEVGDGQTNKDGHLTHR